MSAPVSFPNNCSLQAGILDNHHYLFNLHDFQPTIVLFCAYFWTEEIITAENLIKNILNQMFSFGGS